MHPLPENSLRMGYIKKKRSLQERERHVLQVTGDPIQREMMEIPPRMTKGGPQGDIYAPCVEGNQSRLEQARRLRDSFFGENEIDRIPDSSEVRIRKLVKSFGLN